MRTVLGITLAAAFVAGACGGTTQHTKVEEVPIDNGSSSSASTQLPPDELSDASVSRSVVPSFDGSAPPGVGPQSLDTQSAAQDAGSQQGAPAAFVKRANGLTEKQCNDLVLHFAKLMAKEHKTTAPAAADIPSHAVYGQMYVDCGATATKKQQKCGMAAHTSAGWKKCME